MKWVSRPDVGVFLLQGELKSSPESKRVIKEWKAVPPCKLYLLKAVLTHKLYLLKAALIHKLQWLTLQSRAYPCLVNPVVSPWCPQRWSHQRGIPWGFLLCKAKRALGWVLVAPATAVEVVLLWKPWYERREEMVLVFDQTEDELKADPVHEQMFLRRPGKMALW